MADRAGRWLAALLVLAFALRFGLACAFPTIYRPDEIFQAFEPAFRLWTGHGVQTWEWHAGIRSPLFPVVLAGIMAASGGLGLEPGFYLPAIAGLMTAISLAVVVAGFRLGQARFGLAGAVTCGVLCAAWPDLVYFGPKTMTEVLAGNLLALAAVQAQLATTRRHLALAGLLLGLVFCLRFQLAPALGVIALLAGGTAWRRWVALALGALGPVLAMGLADLVWWGAPFASIWRNFGLNIGQHVAADFGTRPPFWYVLRLREDWGLGFPLVLVFFLLGARQTVGLAVAAVVVILSHSLIAHKEFSYIYPAIPAVIIVAGLGVCEAVAWITRNVTPPSPAVAPVLLLTASLAIGLAPGFRPLWRSHAAVIEAEADLARAPALCGVGFRWPTLWWFWTGGHAVLGRPVPLYAFGTPAGVARVAPAIDAAIGGEDVADGLPGFTRVGCWHDTGGAICLARAAPDHVCVPDPALDLERVPDLGLPGTEHGGDHG